MSKKNNSYEWLRLAEEMHKRQIEALSTSIYWTPDWQPSDSFKKEFPDSVAKENDKDNSKIPLVEMDNYTRPELKYCITHEDAVKLLGLSEKDAKGITINKYCYPDGLIVEVLPPVLKPNSSDVVNPTNGKLECPEYGFGTSEDLVKNNDEYDEITVSNNWVYPIWDDEKLPRLKFFSPFGLPTEKEIREYYNKMKINTSHAKLLGVTDIDNVVREIKTIIK